MDELLIPLIALGVIIWLIFLVINSIQQSAKKYSDQQKLRSEIVNKYPTTQTDRTKSLEERNNELIEGHLSQLRQDSWPHYVENKVSDCIKEIAIREGFPNFAPKFREWLPIWEKRQGIPPEYIQLKNSLLTRFKAKYQQALDEQKKKQELVEQEYEDKIDKEARSFLEQKKDIVNKFLEIAERKVSVIDDYGDESWDSLSKEIEACIRKIAITDNISEVNIRDFLRKGRSWNLPRHYRDLPRILEKLFKEYHEIHKNDSRNNADLNGLSGIEFETHLSRIFKESGYEVSGTPTTGDQGADLLVKKNGKMLVIQAKRYQGSVGNKAVQEVASAVSFYGGNEGWVITNSMFTPSAKALAQKNNIKLIDGHDLLRLNDLIASTE